MHKEMASLIPGLPKETNVSRESMLIVLRILYGELVDNDLIGWLASLKYDKE